MRNAAQRSSQCARKVFCWSSESKAATFERSALGVLDGALDGAFTIGIPHAARIGDHAIKREQLGIDRVQGRLAELRRDGAFVEIVEHNLLGTAAARAESFLVQQRPGLLIGLPDLCGSFYRST